MEDEGEPKAVTEDVQLGTTDCQKTVSIFLSPFLIFNSVWVILSHAGDNLLKESGLLQRIKYNCESN